MPWFEQKLQYKMYIVSRIDYFTRRMNQSSLRLWKQQTFVSIFKRKVTTTVLKEKTTALDIRKIHYHYPWSVTDVIDIRSKEMYQRNHIPGAINIPLVNDIVGKKQNSDWKNNHYVTTKSTDNSLMKYFTRKKSPEFCPLVYCETGRWASEIGVHIATEAGLDVLYLLKNGYLSYTKQVLKDLQTLPLQFTFKVISGFAGTGKTFLLTKLAERGHQVLDLECLAKHKGSMLGLWYGETQPCKDKWLSLLRNTLTKFDPSKPVWVESESQRIGTLGIPPVLFEQICKGDRFKIVLPTEERIKWSLQDYPYWLEDKDALMNIVWKLEKYCGKEKVNYWISLIESERWEEFVHHLLIEHYDPTYERSQNKNKLTNIEKEVFMKDQSEEVVNSTLEFLTRSAADLKTKCD
ncbi:tRNA 2-selenouridine synthase-like isoform X2 [Pecten maximus]|uniref:tRNA 2-selenouridine synthase-like isoform X2 n=1 Tax=Pecten maximus TaxID=6579 RepID=UPI001458F441|nr:tRNA 2-selenouridine synthase-like isoform X2 [Pecten maximus]